MKITTFYRYPDLDARIGIHVDLARVTVSFLAQGSAYKGGELYRRNPDRTAAVDRLLPALFLDMARAGKKGSAPFSVYDVGQAEAKTTERARKAYSKGGNYRFDVLHIGRIDPESLGLVPCENRPVTHDKLR